MRGTGAQGTGESRLAPGLLKGNLGRLNSGVWGTGHDWKGVQQPPGWYMGEGKLRVRTWGTGMIKGTRREAEELHGSQSRESGNLCQKAPWYLAEEGK